MKLDVLCCNCKVHILQADTETLRLPMTGAMFVRKDGMEWFLEFDDTSPAIMLTCPQCGWLFHVEQSLLVRPKGSNTVAKLCNPETVMDDLGYIDGKSPEEQKKERDFIAFLQTNPPGCFNTDCEFYGPCGNGATIACVESMTASAALERMNAPVPTPPSPPQTFTETVHTPKNKGGRPKGSKTKKAAKKKTAKKKTVKETADVAGIQT